MMRLVPLSLVVSLLLAGGHALYAQQGFGVLQASSAELENVELDKSSGKFYARAKAVYDSLVQAKGDFRFPPPAFFLSSGTQNFARLSGDNLSIILEKKALKFCLDRGERGRAILAAVLGHELSHYYEKHLLGGSIAYNYTDPELDTLVRQVDAQLGSTPLSGQLSRAIFDSQQKMARLMAETEADYLGGFLAYSAGYPIADLGEAYADIYQAYGFKDPIPGYGSMQERKEMAEAAHQRLLEFVDIYDLANILTADNQFAGARQLYKFILQEYQGREVYNNLGVLTVLEALSYFDGEVTKYRLPLTIDLEFGVNSRGAGDDKKALREKLLLEALSYLQSAVSLDPNYTTAYLNQACVYYLLEDYERATFYATAEAKDPQRAGVKNYDQVATNAEVLLALIEIRKSPKKGQKTAIKMLEAIQERSPIARANLDVLRGVEPPAKTGVGSPNWKIDGFGKRNLLEATEDLEKTKDIDIAGESFVRLWDNNERLQQSRYFRYKLPGNPDLPFLHVLLTNQDYGGMNDDGFGIGDDAKLIRAEYGAPKRQLATSSGEIWVYSDIALIIGPDQKVKRYARWQADRL